MNLHFVVLCFVITGIQFEQIECGKKMEPDELKVMLAPMSKTCKRKTGATDELVHGTIDGKFPRDRSLMCYFKCMMIILKAMNKQGELTRDELFKNIDLLVVEHLAVRMKDIALKCAETEPLSNPDTCELAFNLVLCGYQIDSSLYFMPT